MNAREMNRREFGASLQDPVAFSMAPALSLAARRAATVGMLRTTAGSMRGCESIPSAR
jgi:hypothetical protein